MIKSPIHRARGEGRRLVATMATREDTFPKLLMRNAVLYGDLPALRHKYLGIWQTWTWAEVAEIVRAYAQGLQDLGLVHGDTIAIIGTNRPNHCGDAA